MELSQSDYVEINTKFMDPKGNSVRYPYLQVD